MFEILIKDIYGHVPNGLNEGLQSLVPAAPDSADSPALWDETDTVLITYADQVRSPGRTPLQAQHQFLVDRDLQHSIGCVHLLPFCPFSSDDGFSVIDYLAVDPESGTWDDIAEMSSDFDLMFDLVLNHASQHHEWFKKFLRDEEGYETYFIDQDPSADLSQVVRPRSLPLLTPFDTPTGTKNVWTTFSDDQVDLNYADPKVLLAMTETIVEYAKRGARIIRLDAIAFLWKVPGTTSIHLPQTHAIVRLMRAVLDAAVPGTIVLTETNVPHKENVSYFGNGRDEAHMVYQFSLPPLMLDAIHSGDTTYLRDWLATLSPPADETTFFNFTASHDGVGVRPLEGIIPNERLNHLVEVVRKHGGRVNMRAQPDGSESPYELNITYLDAVADRSETPAPEHARRFLATQAFMLAMQGVPAVYFHSLVGTPNDQDAVATSGQNRRINRHKYDRQELDDALADTNGLQRMVFDGYQQLLTARRAQPAFHPSASQRVLDLPGNGVIGFVRTNEDGDQITVLANLSATPKSVSEDVLAGDGVDVLCDEPCKHGMPIELGSFQVRWIRSSS